MTEKFQSPERLNFLSLERLAEDSDCADHVSQTNKETSPCCRRDTREGALKVSPVFIDAFKMFYNDIPTLQTLSTSLHVSTGTVISFQHGVFSSL